MRKNSTTSRSKASRMLKYDDRELSISEWATELKINSKTIAARLKAGKSVEEALTAPVKTQANRQLPTKGY